MNKLEDTQQLPALSFVPPIPQPYTSLVQVEFGSATHVGKVRQTNEDSFVIFSLSRHFENLQSNLPPEQIPALFREVSYVMAVADGMGGTEGGEVASALALRAAVTAILNAPSWTLRFDQLNFREQLIAQTLERGLGYFKAAHQAILRLAEGGGPMVNRMGTTLTATYSSGHDLFVMHIGDSRAYLFRNGQLHLLTRDHTLVQDLLEAGKISAEEAAHHRLGHVLTRALSAQSNEVKIEIGSLRLEDGDLILLCSDGLNSMVDAASIAATLAKPVPPPEMCQELIEAALQAGGRDNVTVVLGRYHLPADPFRAQPSATT